MPDKKRIEDLPNYLVKRSEQLDNLITYTETKADVNLVKALRPDVVVNATGSKPLLPPINGLLDHIDKEEGKVYSIFGLLNGLNWVNPPDGGFILLAKKGD